MANNNRDNDNKNLYYLSELSDYKVADDDPDVRGWQVKDADNRVIGKVDNMLVNKRSERVVYLDVEVDKTIIEADHDPYGQPANSDVHEFINKEGENHIIIPVGLVNLNEDQKFVYTDRINHQTFAETKRIQKGSRVNRDYEVVVLDSYNRDYRDDDRNRISDTDFNDRRDRRDNDSTISDGRTVSSSNRVERRDPDLDDNRRDDDYRRDADRGSSRDVENRDRDRGAGLGDRGRDNDDDSFYDRKEFERRNYRRRT